ncbi:MAG: 8-amino-7-oxononanoate synthase [Alphaproteobacteria bacterium]|nr:8-amino-7-oxononanoate synthase [Alphaproteobacteria bacterium]MBL7096597.1 8-amino-7-oxononanoate synthase [Alphaproteobacteria bacterium]
MTSLDGFAANKLRELEQKHIRRILVDTFREDGVHVTRGGRQFTSFSCNDYLNLTHHPAVKQAAIDAIVRHGAGAGASRLVTGNHPLYSELEARLAAFKGAEAACVFGSGYLANAGIIPVLVGPDDLILADELSHSCLWAGAQLSRAKVLMFRHNSVEHAEQLLAQARAGHGHALILTDGIFSMDGDRAPLAELSALASRHDAWLMSDDAHGLGVVGSGQGSAHAAGTRVPIDLQMGTLSKALGSCGGYLCASQPVIDLVRTRARTLVYSTGLPPASAAAAISALDIIAQEPELVARPLANAQAFASLAGLPAAESPIVPVVLGDEVLALRAQQVLEAEALLVTAIRPPTVPPGTARLRIAFTAGHSHHDIERLARVVRRQILPMQVSA